MGSSDAPSPSPGATQAPGAQPNRMEVARSFAQLTPQTSTGRPDIAFGTKYGPLGGGRGAAREPDEGSRMGWTSYTKSVQEMTLEYYGWSDKDKATLRAKLAMIDKDALKATDDQIASMWGSYVQQSANHLAGGVSISPWDILAKDITTRGGSPSLAGTKTQKTTDTSLTSRVDAEALFTQAAQQLLGRDPTKQESAAFHNMLNAQEKANPTVATTTTTTDEEGNVVSQSRTSTGGLGAGGAQLLAKQKAEENPEYGAYQAATTYYNAMMQVIQRGY